MKNSKLILILALISFCSSQSDNTCSASFQTELGKKCPKIDSDFCSLDEVLGCYRRGCGNAKDEESCKNTLPAVSGNINFHNHKCEWTYNSRTGKDECMQKPKKCSDYNKFSFYYKKDGGDICSSLEPDDEDVDKECVLENNKENGCKPHYKDCSKVPDVYCTSTIVSKFATECDFDSSKTPKCFPKRESRTCSWISSRSGQLSTYDLQNGNNNCGDFSTTNNEEKCIYFKGKCKVAYLNCGKYLSESSCITFSFSGNSMNHDYYNMPLIQNQNNYFEYDYSQKCYWDMDSETCKETEINCSDYDGDQEICLNLKKKLQDGTYVQKCIYESNKCKEKYTECALYDEETDKERDKCQNSILPGINKKCVYNLPEDKCEEKKTYNSCDEYNQESGKKDRLICESIISKNHPFYCVLDRDNQCIERELSCSEVYDENECLHIAKPSDPNKKCAFDGTKCYEEYIRCEDYIEKYYLNCTGIRLYNGLQCEYESESERCRTRNKFCCEARTEEECKLIAKTGVSDPKRKVCDYIDYDDDDDEVVDGNGCRETFKYCSDYRGTNPIICKNIKPYDYEEGEKIDEFSKCEMIENKCQRIPKECEEIIDNPIQCIKLGLLIKDNSIKYCRYDKYNTQHKCITDYRKCNSYKATSTSNSDSDYGTKKTDCEKIIPEDYNSGFCKYEQDDSDQIFKCLPKKECTDINDDTEKDKYEGLCNKLDPKCVYDSTSNICNTKERSCVQIRFYSDTEGTEEYCNAIDASSPYKKCVLKEDKSGCEEIYREYTFSTAYSSYKEPPGTQSEASSDMIRGINLIIILLCLLF